MTSSERSKIIALRFDADHAIGGGHLQRCLALAAGLPQEDILFVVRGNEEVLSRQLAGRKYVLLPAELPVNQELAYWSEKTDLSSLAAVFFDLSHARTYRDPRFLQGYTKQLRAAGVLSVAIDGLLSDSLLHLEINFGFDFVVTPYVGAEKKAGTFTHLFGPQYFILPPGLRAHRPSRKKIAPQAREILVTMGRSDPTDSTMQVLRALEDLAPQLTMRVVVGDLFSPTLRADIQAFAACHSGVQLLDAPPDIALELARADLALVGAGLTKYELAFVGTPGIFFSTNDSMHQINQLFATAGSGWALGPLSALSAEAIRKAVAELAADAKQREAMAQAGLGLVDGQGATRILAAVLGRKP